MVNLQFCYLANVIMVSRLVLTFRDDPVARKQTAIMMLLQIAGLLVYEIGYALAILMGTLVAINVLFHFLENRLGKTNELRLLSLLICTIVLSTFFSPWIDLDFNPGLSNLSQSLGHYSLLLAPAGSVDWLKFNIVLLGLLLVTNEVNILIRYQFQIFNLAPKKEIQVDERIVTSIDKREYNAGRVIGMLERVLVYFFVLNAQFAAIGLILAAKSFTRFKELEKREFAEYVLIGTLLSTLLAMLVAVIAQFLLP